MVSCAHTTQAALCYELFLHVRSWGQGLSLIFLFWLLHRVSRSLKKCWCWFAASDIREQECTRKVLSHWRSFTAAPGESFNLEVRPADAKQHPLRGQAISAMAGAVRPADLLKAWGNVAKLAGEHRIWLSSEKQTRSTKEKVWTLSTPRAEFKPHLRFMLILWP